MKVVRILLFIAVVFCATSKVLAQQDLPSAPSATIAPAQQPAQPTAAEQAGASQQPAGNDKPVLESLEQKKVQAPSAAQINAMSPAPDKGDDPTSADAKAAAKENPDEFTVKRKVEEVNVIFAVTDKHGRFIKDLKQNEFSVLDDKRPALAIRSFSAQTDLPLRVGLLIDASNSIRDRFKFEQEAAIEFLNQIVRAKDEAFVVGFDSTTEVVQDFTNSTEKLSSGVRMLRPGGGTALYDAVYRACKEKLMTHPDKDTVRRAIILLSDGDDNQSRVTREEAIEMAQRAEVVIYSISTNLADKGRGDRELERMADATGGKAFFPFKIQDVSNAFSEIQAELRSQYALAYKPADFAADGRYRSIEITPKEKKFKVRSRKGYFAPKG